MATRRRSHRIIAGRYMVNDHEGYQAEWCEGCEPGYLVVIRVSDGQIVAYGKVDIVWFRGCSFEVFEEAIMAFLKKVSDKDRVNAGVPSKFGEAWRDKHPAIVEYLTCEHDDDGNARLRSTLAVFVEEDTWKVVLNDKQNERSLFVSGASLVDALDALELLLRAGQGEWRAQKPWKPGKRSQAR